MSFSPTNFVLLIEPLSFKYNEQTASNNTFQEESTEEDSIINNNAKLEFKILKETLEKNGVKVLSITDLPNQNTPDSVFPNNWISTHETGEIFIYPMYAKNRRSEIRTDIIQLLQKELNYNKVVDFSHYVKQNQFLEGTGSMVLERGNKVAYCCLSERSHLPVLKEWTNLMDYEMVYFDAFNEFGVPIYHTNVMLTLASDYAVICLDSIHDIEQRTMVIESLEENGKEIIDLSYHQMNEFAGNMIELSNEKGESLLVMSEAAYKSLEPSQIKGLSKYSQLISIPIPTIEKNGGGSVRCMIAELVAFTS